ncbi:MAG: hypothetical protein KBONHNOK_00733 [Candidatus Methanoperedenaceae archaeon GB50]|nr:MAG: hypothetical protein KBONHNOK_00733 [Candidatus Methanoperedenaceae archaeon GB50]
MRELNVKFQYCYGIKRLEHKFEFSNRTFAIYAPNGVMKTSFAKTFKDFAEERETKDLAFPDRETIRVITSDASIRPFNIFVVEPYNEDYQSEKMSTLLVNKKLKSEYETIHKDIDKVKKDLIKKLKQLSGLTGRTDNIEEVVEKIFGKNLYEFLLENESLISKSESLPFNHIQYSKIFNDRVLRFLETKDFKEAIKEYIEKYNELIDKSPYLRKEFTFYHAENVQRQLTSNNFFKAGHSVNLSDGESKKEYSDGRELEKLLVDEKKKVLEDEGLREKFDEINSRLTNRELREFRDYLLENREILPELANLEEFKKKIWHSYFVDQKDLLLELTKKYKDGQEKIKELVEKARREQTDWEEVIRIFNKRFSHLPFYLKVENKEDVILKDEVPTINFMFKDEENERVFEDRNELLRILSTGEKKALYILNIIFEVEVRKKENNETLFVIDDIADSFDYKNKYAIVDYLLYMSEEEKFYIIILTHNFDFFRTIKSRLGIKWENCLVAVRKSDGRISLESIVGKSIINPFKGWIENLTNKKKLIALIPFVRNIIEYTRGIDDDEYLLLTSVLHHKEDTENITLEDIKKVFEAKISNIDFPNSNLNEKMIDLIFETAEECLSADEGINLENKIVFSIAIRLKAEQFMKVKITDNDFLSDIKKNQTWELLKKYEEEFNDKKENIEVLQRVNLITPENIHLNSFMYEPILDMGDYELKELYNEIKRLDD